MQSRYDKYLKISFINTLVLIICFLASYSNVAKLLVWPLTIVGYLIFLLVQKKDSDIVIYQLIMLIISTFILDFTFHYLKIRTPLELKYISEGISFILILRIIINWRKYKVILNDSILIILSTIIIFGFIIGLINGNGILNLFNGVRIYLRFIPTYIILTVESISIKNIYKYLYIANILIFLIQTIAGINQDLRTGIFSIISTVAFEIFIIIYYIKNLIYYLYKKISLNRFLTIFAITTIMFALAENKAAMLIFIVISIVILLMINSKMIKKIISIIVLVMMLISGWNLMIKLYPKFYWMSDLTKIFEFAEEYLLGNSNELYFQMGRFEAVGYINRKEKNDLTSKVVGLGIGASIPPENLFYVLDGNGRQNIIDFPESKVFFKYGSGVGYHLSSAGIIFIDLGYIGILVLISIVIIVFKRGFYLLRYGNCIDIKVVGGIGIYISLSSIFSCGYGTALNDRSYLFIICIILGINRYYYVEQKKENKIVMEESYE